MMDQLTPREREVLDELRRFIGAVGFPPTLRELGDRLEISAPAVQKHLERLATKGAIVRESGKQRAIRITDG